MLFKIRITSTDPDEAEALRTALRSIFGAKLTLTKARKGGNPKYADSPNLLAYGELEITAGELAALANVNQIKLPLKGRKAKAKV